MAEKLTAAPSDTSRKQNIENFENCDTASDISTIVATKLIYHLNRTSNSKNKSTKPS